MIPNALHHRGILLQLGLLSLTLGLTACGGDSNDSNPAEVSAREGVVVLATAASDYSSGAVELISVADKTSSGSYHPTISDIGISANGTDYYLYERFQADRVKKVDLNNPAVLEWTYSAVNASDTDSSNPYTMVFAQADKAYLIRYGSDTAWIVDPTATTESAFKIGELDLSAYTPTDGQGVPNMSAGAIVGDKLFIAMQRIDSLWQPNNTAYLAVFDTATDTEIDTGQDSGDLKGIPLIGKNPSSLTYQNELGLLVQHQGAYTPDYTGGIDVVDVDSYAAEQRVNDTAATGLIGGIAIADATTGYYLAYGGWQNITLRAFNPTTGEVKDGAIAGLSAMDLRSLGIGPQGNLWVADATSSKPGLRVIDLSTEAQTSFVSTSLLPIDLAFAKQ